MAYDKYRRGGSSDLFGVLSTGLFVVSAGMLTMGVMGFFAPRSSSALGTGREVTPMQAVQIEEGVGAVNGAPRDVETK